MSHLPSFEELQMRIRVHEWLVVIGAARGLLLADNHPTIQETVDAARQAAEEDLEFLATLLPDRPLDQSDVKRALRKILQRATEILDREAMQPQRS